MRDVKNRLMTSQVLVVDALSAGSGRRRSSRDSIGCGPRAIAGVLEKHGVHCRIERVESVIQKSSILRRFDHLAISAMSMDLPSVGKVSAIWKKSHTSGRVVVGGPITLNTEILADLKVDLFVIGEGEATVDELLTRGYFDAKIDTKDIPGVAYREDNRIVITPQRAPLSPAELSVDYRPSTTRILDYPTYQASKVYVEVLRGCSNYRRTTLPMIDGRECTDCGNCDSEDAANRMDCPEGIPPGCGFCSVPAVWGPPRSRSAEAITSEIRELVNLGVNRIVLEAPGFLDYMRGQPPLTDPCSPAANIGALKELLTEIESIPPVATGDVHIAIENMKACLFTEAVAQTLVDTGFSSSPNIGIETGSARHMKSIGKCGSPDEVLEATKIAVGHGMKPFVYFIFGLPGESEESTSESIRMMWKLYEAGVERIILYGFRPLPASAFEGYPSSSQESEFGKRLRREADKINRLRKDEYVDRVVRGIAAEPSWVRHGYTMVYPLGEGPIMTVQGGYSSGSRLTVRITRVLSSGLVEAEVIQSE